MKAGLAISLDPADRLLQQPDRYIARSIQERFPKPGAKQTARAFADQISKVRSLQGSVPSVARKHATEIDFMSADQFRRTLGEQIAVALRKRVGPGTGLTVKQLAYTLRVDQQTVWKLLNGYNSPSGPVLMALISFFDAAFANEILEPCGCQVAKFGDARAHALRKVAEGLAELKAMDGR